MSKRISAGGKPLHAKRTIERTTSTAVPVSKPKVNKTPCSLCHQVVEELKYHYDICEPCHQKEEEDDDMDVDHENQELDYSSGEESTDVEWFDSQEEKVCAVSTKENIETEHDDDQK